MIRKHKAKDGTITYYVYAPLEDGGKEYLGSCRTKKEADELEATKRVERKQVREGKLPAEAFSKITVRKAGELFLKNYEESTRAAYEYRLRLYVYPVIGDLELAKVTTADAVKV